MEDTQSGQPADIEVDVEQRELRIAWEDGERCTYSFELLRRACPCARCRGHTSQTDRLLTGDFSGEALDLVDVSPVGRYAINLKWANGHGTGIYPFTLLRRLCHPERLS